MFEAIFLWAREIRSSSEIKPLSSCAVCKAKASINVSVELMAIFEERSSEMSQWQSKKRSEIWNDKKKTLQTQSVKGIFDYFFLSFFLGWCWDVMYMKNSLYIYVCEIHAKTYIALVFLPFLSSSISWMAELHRCL